MNRIISVTLVLCFLTFSLGHAFPHQHEITHYTQVMAAHKAKGAIFTRYMAKIAALKNRLKGKIPTYEFGSFYGATAQDTRWALAVTQNPEQMAEIYAENRMEKGAQQPEVLVAYQIDEGELVFAKSLSHLNRYKADPSKASVIRMAATEYGPRVAASTVLTEEGLSVQAESGCIGCHSS